MCVCVFVGLYQRLRVIPVSEPQRSRADEQRTYGTWEKKSHHISQVQQHAFAANVFMYGCNRVCMCVCRTLIQRIYGEYTDFRLN